MTTAKCTRRDALQGVSPGPSEDGRRDSVALRGFTALMARQFTIVGTAFRPSTLKLALQYALVVVFSVQVLLHPLTHALGGSEAQRGAVCNGAESEPHAGNSNPDCVACRTASTALVVESSSVERDAPLVDRIPVSHCEFERIDRSISVPARSPPLSVV